MMPMALQLAQERLDEGVAVVVCHTVDWVILLVILGY